MTDMILTRDTISGQVAEVPAAYLDIPEFAAHLLPVSEGTKSYVSGMHAETDVEGRDETGKQVREEPARTGRRAERRR